MENGKNFSEEPVVGYQKIYNYGDYLKFEFDHMVELIRGRIFNMSPAPSMKHQKVLGELHLVFGNYLKQKKCNVYIAPVDVVLPVQNRKNKLKNTTVVQPDLVVICDDRIIEDACVFGAPDLLVEIISPHTKKKDIRLKYEVYEEAGVKEYWVIYPLDGLVEIHVLTDGKYQRKGTFIDGDIIAPSMIPNLKVDLTEVF